MALLVTFSLLTFALTYGLMSLAGSLMRHWEMFLALLLIVFVFAPFGVDAFMFALISNRRQHHALIWIGVLAIHIAVAAFSFFIFSRRIGSLRTPSGYERWLQLAEEKFRQAQRWQI